MAGLLKLVDQSTYPGSSISAKVSDVNIYAKKASNIIERLLIKWKYNRSHEIKRDFFET